jgi:hypothetical protein
MESGIDDELIVEQLADGDAGPVLVADFEPFSPEPRLGELLAAAVRGRPVYQIDPVGALSGDRIYVPLSELAAKYAGAFLASVHANGQVFVVGHCSAAGLSLRITNLLAGSRKVAAILLQPSWPGDQQIGQLFTEFQANLGSTNHPCPDLDSDPASSVASMAEILREQIAAVAANRGVAGGAGVFQELLARYRAWLAFLLACRNDVPVALVDGVTSVKLYTSSSGAIAIPGIPPGDYEIERLAGRGNESPSTAKLADLALAEIAQH